MNDNADRLAVMWVAARLGRLWQSPRATAEIKARTLRHAEALREYARERWDSRPASAGGLAS